MSLDVHISYWPYLAIKKVPQLDVSGGHMKWIKNRFKELIQHHKRLEPEKNYHVIHHEYFSFWK
jgi:hypothetical protein